MIDSLDDWKLRVDSVPRIEVLRVWAIAANTLREVFRQPTYPIVIVGFAVLVLASPLYTAFGFGSEGVLVREAGLATIVLCGLIIALLSSTRIVHREIETGTARIVLTKPVATHEYLVGKFLGLAGVMLVSTFVLTAALMATVGWSKGGAVAPLALGGVAAYFELLLLSSVALSFSVHLSFVPNAALCTAVFLLGGLPSFFREPSWFGAPRLLLPDFQSFQVVFEAVTTGTPLAASYLLSAAAYGILYSAAVLLLGVYGLSRRENL